MINLQINPYINKFINFLMIDGKKEVAERILIQTFNLLRKQAKKDPVIIFLSALNNAMPHIGLTKVRIRGKYSLVPIPLTENKKLKLVMKWIIQSTESKNNLPFSFKLANILLNTAKKKGEVIQLKKALYQDVQRNRQNIFLRIRRKRKFLRKKK